MNSPHKVGNRQTLLRVEKAIVWSKLFYGIEIYGSALDLFIKKLGPTYNIATRVAAGLLPSTPADAVSVETGLLPFRHLATEIISRRAVGYDERTPGSGKVCLLLEGRRAFRISTRQRLPPVARVHWTGAKRWDLPVIRFEEAIRKEFTAGDTSPELRKRVAEILSTKYSRFRHIYTDGSKTKDGVGFGMVDDGLGSSHRLPKQCSIFSAEAAALLAAVSTESERPTLIITDSASALDALKSQIQKHPWIQAITNIVNQRTVFMWVPSHVGIPGNEEADRMANLGRQGRLFTNKVPAHDIKHWISNVIRNTWDSEWFASRSLFIRKVKPSTMAWEDRQDWREQRVVSRLRSGHTRATHNFGNTTNFKRQCPECEEYCSVEHLLSICPSTEPFRAANEISTNVDEALANNPAAEARIIGFCKDFRIFHNI